MLTAVLYTRAALRELLPHRLLERAQRPVHAQHGEHRANPGMPTSESPPNAYVHEDYAVTMIESVGFELLGKSDINNNPKDTKDYPVWSLPPNYMNGDKDRAKYEAIGESDRFTLKFMKPVK